MDKVYVAKQEILDRDGKLFAHELLFRDTAHGIKEFPSDLKATSQVIMNAITNMGLDTLIGEKGLAFINVNDVILNSGILDILDKDRFILEILETSELCEDTIAKIKQYHKRGFKFAIDDFDCSAAMIVKFNPLFKYMSFIKMDVLASEPQNLKNVMTKLKTKGVTLLAEKVETKEEYESYLKMGFDLFQGYYLHKPKIIEVDRHKEATKIIILQLIKVIKDSGETSDIEKFIKRQPELSFKLVKFLNNQGNFTTKIESIIQVITLLGRDKLLRWLMIYLYSETSNNPASEQILKMAIERASMMEREAPKEDKQKAYIAGMFSMLDSIFDSPIKDIMEQIKMEQEIINLVVHKKGKFAASLARAEDYEKTYLQELIISNAKKFSIVDMIGILERTGVAIKSLEK